LASNPKELRIKQLKKMPEYKEWTKTFSQGNDPIEEKNINTNTVTDTPEEILATTVDSLHKQLASDLLDKLKENSFSYFENFVIELLLEMGYGNFREDAKQVTGMTGDDGIDGVISQDRLGLENVYIQAKRFTDNTVGSGDIRNFIGSLTLKGVTKGVFLTTSRFTKSATQTAEDSKQQKIILIDGQHLANLAIEYNLGV
jgi:restriction system protein